MMKNLMSVFAMGGAALLAQACSHGSTSDHLDQKVATEVAPRNSAEMRIEARSAIDSAPNLTPNQRSQLKSLGAATSQQMTELRDQSLKLRAILVQDIVSANYNPREVNQIKQRIKRVEDQRLSVMFSAIDSANEMIGRSPNNKEMIEELTGHWSRFDGVE